MVERLLAQTSLYPKGPIREATSILDLFFGIVYYNIYTIISNARTITFLWIDVVSM